MREKSVYRPSASWQKSALGWSRGLSLAVPILLAAPPVPTPGQHSSLCRGLQTGDSPQAGNGGREAERQRERRGSWGRCHMGSEKSCREGTGLWAGRPETEEGARGRGAEEEATESPGRL